MHVAVWAATPYWPCGRAADTGGATFTVCKCTILHCSNVGCYSTNAKLKTREVDLWYASCGYVFDRLSMPVHNVIL